MGTREHQDVPVLAGPDFGKFMGGNQFKEYHKVIAKIWELKSLINNCKI